LETPIVTSRVVAEIYRGIDFPPDWIGKPDVLNLGMARDLLVSVAAMFDSDLQPVALCWRIDGREERFVHIRPNGPADSSPLDELHRDLADESVRLGSTDLLATICPAGPPTLPTLTSTAKWRYCSAALSCSVH